MRVGLVLGAGGVVGASWLIGAVEALKAETGWDPASAERIVGTSAGSVVGSLIAEGIPPEYLAAYVTGRALDATAEADARVKQLAARLSGLGRIDELARELSGAEFRLHRALPPIGPGSWRLALSTARAPWRHAPTALVAGWLPRGFVSTAPITQVVETFVRGRWPDHPGFRAVAADYATGRRVAFGGGDAPAAAVGDAVAASCAIPAFYHPVRIAGRRYVDGGICSLSNLDLLLGEELDLVVCLNPTSSLAEAMGGTPGDRVGAALRAISGRRLGYEARRLREEGTQVLLVQPDGEEVAGMGINLMARGRRVEVLERARRNVALALRELRGTDALLPPRTRARGRGRAARTGPARAARDPGARRRAA